MAVCVTVVGDVTSRDGGKADEDGSDAGDSGSEDCVGMEYCESCEWLRTDGGSSGGMGGGMVVTV